MAKSGQLDEYALAIGHLCIDWASLESVIDIFMWEFLNKPPEDEFNTMAHNIGLRDTIQIALGLCYIKRPSDEWFDVLKWALDNIDNDLRPRRNRFVHDRWAINPDGIYQIQGKTGFRKPEAFKTEYFSKIPHKRDIGELQKLLEDILDVSTVLVTLWSSVGDADFDWKTPLGERGLLPPHMTEPGKSLR